MPPHCWYFPPGICQLYDLNLWTVCYLGTAQANNKKDHSERYNVEVVSFQRREIGHQGV